MAMPPSGRLKVSIRCSTANNEFLETPYCSNRLSYPPKAGQDSNLRRM
ncbi:MAG: hypothetical protein HXM85_03675 [Neisseria sp.]|nr:hypothetical protein [Neisseria sp.]